MIKLASFFRMDFQKFDGMVIFSCKSFFLRYLVIDGKQESYSALLMYFRHTIKTSICTIYKIYFVSELIGYSAERN